MHDIKWIRENPEAFDRGLARRGMEAISAQALEIDAQNKAITTELQDLQTRRNDASKQIGVLKGKGEDADALMGEVAELKERMASLETGQNEAGAAIQSLIEGLPNVPAEDVPDGVDEDDNVEIRRVGDKPVFDFI